MTAPHSRPAAGLAGATSVPAARALRTADRLASTLRLSSRDVRDGRHRILLSRFISDHIPVASACIWTWARLVAAPGRFRVGGRLPDRTARRAERRLNRLLDRLHRPGHDSGGGGASFLADLAAGLFRDGFFGGFLTIDRAATGVDRFLPVDPAAVRLDTDNSRRLLYETDTRTVRLDRPDFYYVPLGAGVNRPLGRSILSAVPFVAYVEQQLVDDMRRASHNSGFHRLHVKITPPERMAGESDSAYVDRINSYFDSTVSMIRSCDVDDNPVTWDNVAIEYIGPENTRSVSNSWFFNHRAMIEEICAGTNLAPFLLGYSYGATTTWSAFKFDLVMRQVRSVQADLARFLEWIASVDLALAGIEADCRFEFDNTFAYQAGDRADIESKRVDNIIRLYEAGLLDKETARDRAGCLP